MDDALKQRLVSNTLSETIVWKYPPLDLLSEEPIDKAERGNIKLNSEKIEKTLKSFGITSKVVEVNFGPATTQYVLELPTGTKMSLVLGLEQELALALASKTGHVYIEAPIPGQSYIGIYLPNNAIEFVPLRKVLASNAMAASNSKLMVAVGLDSAGIAVTADIRKMPYAVIAGTAMSGKTTLLNTWISSLLFRAAPTEVKLILIDPSRVGLTLFNGIPHLLSPVIVNPEKVISALRWVLAEMDRRYKLLAEAGAKNIDTYNEMSGFQALPYIVIFLDDFANIERFSPMEIEDALFYITESGWSAGIHLVISTQRPSVDIIPGLIKAKVPARISFTLPSFVDSQTILDGPWAKDLLGNGDMYYLPSNANKPMRVQGAFVNDKEITELVTFIKNQEI